MSVRIGQASLGETGAHGQKPGNQTGSRIKLRVLVLWKLARRSPVQGPQESRASPRRRAKLVSATRTSGTIRTVATQPTSLRKR